MGLPRTSTASYKLNAGYPMVAVDGENPVVAMVERQRRKTLIIERQSIMDNHVYKIAELVGTSESGVGETVENALQRTSQSIRNIRWFETTNIRGSVENGRVKQFQVTCKIGFTLDDDQSGGGA